MKPDPQAVLAIFAELIVSELTPLMADRYGSQQLVRGSPLLAVVATEFDRAAARRIEENHVLRALFREAAAMFSTNADRPAVVDGQAVVDRQAIEGAGDERSALAKRLRDASGGTDTDMSVSSLDAANRGLRSLLIDLQVWVESQNSKAAAAIGQKIWQELRASTERRRSAMDRF